MVLARRLLLLRPYRTPMPLPWHADRAQRGKDLTALPCRITALPCSCNEMVHFVHHDMGGDAARGAMRVREWGQHCIADKHLSDACCDSMNGAVETGRLVAALVARRITEELSFAAGIPLCRQSG